MSSGYPCLGGKRNAHVSGGNARTAPKFIFTLRASFDRIDKESVLPVIQEETQKIVLVVHFLATTKFLIALRFLSRDT